MALLRTLTQLIHQVANQFDVLDADLQHRKEVGRPNRLGEVEEGALLEELAAESGKGSEQQRALAIDPAGIEVGDRHRRGSHGRLAIDLGPLLIRQRCVVADKPEPTDREPGKVDGFRNAGTLQ